VKRLATRTGEHDRAADMRGRHARPTCEPTSAADMRSKPCGRRRSRVVRNAAFRGGRCIGCSSDTRCRVHASSISTASSSHCLGPVTR